MTVISVILGMWRYSCGEYCLRCIFGGVGIGNLTKDFVLEYLHCYVFVLLAAEPHICIPHIM